MKHGCRPFGNAKARCGGLELPGRACRCTASRSTRTRPDLVAKYPTHDDKKRSGACPLLFKSIADEARRARRSTRMILTSGRLVEYEGGGEETRSNPWLAELQQKTFVEINPEGRRPTAASRTASTVWVRRARAGAQAQGAGDGDRAGRPGHRLHAVPLRRPVAGQGHALATTPRAPSRSCSARR